MCCSASTSATEHVRAKQTACVLLKLGGELLEQPQDVERVAGAIARLAKRRAGRRARWRQRDRRGARDGGHSQAAGRWPSRHRRPTLDVVVAVLAGAINTRLVAAVRRAGGKPVGLTGADATVATVKRAAPIVSVAGASVDLGLVGAPVRNGAPQLLTDLLSRGYTPIVACIGATRKRSAAQRERRHAGVASRRAIGARRLVIAGGTSGVLDAEGHTIAKLTDATRRNSSSRHGEQGHGGEAAGVPGSAAAGRR